jgi:hypothetical protein
METFGDDNVEIDVWFSSPGSETFGTIGMFIGDISMLVSSLKLFLICGSFNQPSTKSA